MSQPVSGEVGGAGAIMPHSSTNFVPQSMQPPTGSSYPQGGSFPVVKASNFQMENGLQSPGSMQFNMYSSHTNVNPQLQHMQQINVMKSRGNANMPVYGPQVNPCGNVQYFPGGNYVTTVTVNPTEQFPNQVPVQYMSNSQNFFMNSCHNVMNPVGNFGSMNFQQNMMVGAQNNNSFGNTVTFDPSSKISEDLTSNNTDPNSSAHKITGSKKIGRTVSAARSKSRGNHKKTATYSKEPLESDIMNDNVSENSVIRNCTTSISATSLRTSNSVNYTSNININRPRTSSRCDSVKSETTESSCSSLSFESIPDPNTMHHNPLGNKIGNVSQYDPNIQNCGNTNPYVHGNQMQNISSNAIATNENMNYQNYMACQARMNQVPVIGKQGMLNPGVVQSFHQVNTVQVQSSQMQIMQQQYQCLPGRRIVHPPVRMPHVPVPQPGSIVPNQNIPNILSSADSDKKPTFISCRNQSGNGAIPPNVSVIPQPCGIFTKQDVQSNPTMIPHPNMMVPSTKMGISPSVMIPSIAVIPFGWKRYKNNVGHIVYVSPSGSELRSPMEVCKYLMQENTCKCGLQCPLRVEDIFCFDPKIPHRLTMPNELTSGEATKVCNHRRKLAQAFTDHLQKQAEKEDGRKKNKRKASEAFIESSLPNKAFAPDSDKVCNAQQLQYMHPNMFPNPQTMQMQQMMYINANNFCQFSNENKSNLVHKTQPLENNCSSQQTELPTDEIMQEEQEITNMQSSGLYNMKDIGPETEAVCTDLHDLPGNNIDEQQLKSKQNISCEILKKEELENMEDEVEVRAQPSPAVSMENLENRQTNLQDEVVLQNQPKVLLPQQQATQMCQQQHAHQHQLYSLQPRQHHHCQSNLTASQTASLNPSFYQSQSAQFSQPQFVNQPNQLRSSSLGMQQLSQQQHMHAMTSHQMNPNQLHNFNLKRVHQMIPQELNQTVSRRMNNMTPQQVSLQQLTPHQQQMQQMSSQIQHMIPQQVHQPSPQQMQQTTPQQMIPQEAQHLPMQQPPLQQVTSQKMQQMSSHQMQHMAPHQMIPPQHQVHHNQMNLEQEQVPPNDMLHLNTPIQQVQKVANQQLETRSDQSQTVQQVVLQRTSQQMVEQNTSQFVQQSTPQMIQHNTLQMVQHSTPQMVQQNLPQMVQHSTPQMVQQNTPHMIQQNTPLMVQQNTHENTVQMIPHQNKLEMIQQNNQRTVMQNPPQMVSSENNQQIIQQNIPQLVQLNTPQMVQVNVSSMVQVNASPMVQQNTPQNVSQNTSQVATQNKSQMVQNKTPQKFSQNTNSFQLVQSNTPQQMIQQDTTQLPSENTPQMIQQINTQLDSLNTPQLVQKSTSHLINYTDQSAMPSNQERNLKPEQHSVESSPYPAEAGSTCDEENQCSESEDQCDYSPEQPTPTSEEFQSHTLATSPCADQHHQGYDPVTILSPEQSNIAPCPNQQYQQQGLPHTTVQPHSQIPRPQQMPEFQHAPPNIVHKQNSMPQQISHETVAQHVMFTQQMPNQQQREPPFHLQQQQKNQIQRAPSHMQQYSSLQQYPPMQHPFHMYPPNQHQNWHPMYGGPRMTGPNNTLISAPLDEFSAPFIPGAHHSQGCCEGPSFSGQQHMISQRPPHFTNMVRRPLNMVPQQGDTFPSTSFQGPINPILGMRPNHFNTNNPMCRMPSQVYASEGKSSFAEIENESEVRKTTGRSKKRVKTSFDKNSSGPNINIKALHTQKVTSPHTVQSTPFRPKSQPISQGADSTSSSSNQNKALPPVSVPSFMEDPNGYLAQQTALLNSTMSGGIVGQFSPQGSRLSPHPTKSNTANSCEKTYSQSTSTSDKSFGQRSALSRPSSTIVPLPSNVPLPSRVSKASSPIVSDTSCNSIQSISPNQLPKVSKNEETKEKQRTHAAMVESCGANHTVAVSLTNSTVTTTTCRSQSNSPQSSSLAVHVAAVESNEVSMESQPEAKILEKKTIEAVRAADSISSSSSSLSVEAANKPLTPGPAESTVNTQSPLELVQNIVSSIPLPASSDDLPPLPTRSNPPHLQQTAAAISQQSMLGPQVYNMTNSSGMQRIVYNTVSANQSVLRGTTGPLVVHAPPPTAGSIPQGVIMSSNPNMVMVTSPFNAKVSVEAPVVCSNVNPVVGIPQVQVQSHLQPIQPVVQLVNTFATMQTPMIIQNGSSLLQSNHGGVIGPAAIINNSNFVSSQQLLTVDSSSHQLQMTQIVTSAADEENRLTPITTLASTPSTPLSGSSQGSLTPPSGGGRKRKRRRNTSTSTSQQMQPNLMPAIIMGKTHHMAINGAQISTYGNLVGNTVTGNTASQPPTAGQMLTTSQPSNPINVVQMVSGPMAAPIPVHVQQPTQAILVPSSAAPGVLINQLPDGSFVSTDPNTGVSYPVQLLSGSHIMGVTPVSNAGVVGSINTSSTQGTAVVAVQQPSHMSAKMMNVTPSGQQGETIIHNVYGVPSSSVPVSQSMNSTFIPSQTNHNLQQPIVVGNGNTTLLQQKTTTIVAHQQTTVMTTQRGLTDTHSSVSTQTNGLLSESDVTSSDCIASDSHHHETLATSPSHQSAEISTTRHDDYSAFTPESLILTPPQGLSPEAAPKRQTPSVSQEPHSAPNREDVILSDRVTVVWGPHRGQQYWPAKMVHQDGGDTVIRWYGDHMTETVATSSLSQTPNSNRGTRRSNRGRTALDEAIAEAKDGATQCSQEWDTCAKKTKRRSIR